MKRFFALLLVSLMACQALFAAQVTFDFSTADGIAAMGYAVPPQSSGTNLSLAGAVTVQGVTLSATDGATPTRIWNSQGSYTLRIYVDGSITLAVGQGSITGVAINAANTSNFDLIASVGDYSVAGATGSWTGSAAALTFTHVGSKNAQIATITVTTSDDEPGKDPDDPIDPDITKLDSLSRLGALVEDTAFQFTTDVYVNYQWHDLLWVMQLDDEGYATAGLISGDLGKQYPMGAVIPAGWTARKRTVDGLLQMTEPAHFNNAKNLLGEDYYSPFDCTGYLDYVVDPDEGWESYKVSFSGISLSAVDGDGRFIITSAEAEGDGNPALVTMPGRNLFGIDYPEADPTERYDIEGMVAIEEGNLLLYPIAITPDPGTRLWRVLYGGGTIGQWYKLSDTLYVAAASKADDGLLVYVTDNVDEVYYDVYAEWGYAEWMAWYPDWIALDCGDDEALFNRLAGMKTLAPATVKGVLADRTVNPRLVLQSVPSELADAPYPMLTIFQYDLDEDYLGTTSNELARIDGYYRMMDGEPFLCDAKDSIIVSLDFRYAPQLAALMDEHQGCRFGLLSIFKLKAPWDENMISSPVARRISVNDDDFYTNVTICPLEIVALSSLDELKSDSHDGAAVRFIAPSGIVSNKPHPGLNIIVTTANDGSTTAVKRHFPN